ACQILSQIWAASPEVFVLCALSTTPTSLGTLKSSDCVPKLVTWWKTALHPNGLAAALSRHRELLPDQSLGNLSVISESH
ncbi:hypothetical protein M011DRAFT_472603, partial [Sporormia fimetaria CBS 119925]